MSTTQNVSKSLAFKGSLIAAAVLMAAATPLTTMTAVQARDYDAEIQAVQRQIDQYQAEAGRLSTQAATLEGELAKLNAEKATIQSLINLNQARHDKLVADIAANEKKIATNREALGQTIASLYVDDDISPLEMVASSSSVSEYIDKQTRREAVNKRLTSTIAEIKRLKAELERQRQEVERVLTDQKNQRAALAAKEREKQQLIDKTRGEEAAFQKLSSESRAKKDALQQEQQREIARRMASSRGGGAAVAGDPSRGGYPSHLANSDYYNPVVDPWGMYARQCVSYTAWKVYQKNGHMPYWGGHGNANQWPGNARAAGIPVSKTPRAGSVGVIMAGEYGHVVWVDSVNGDGTINISQYNFLNAGGAGWGHYSEMYNVSPGAYDWYIHF